MKADATDWPPPARPLIATGAGEAVTVVCAARLVPAGPKASNPASGFGNTVTLLPVTVNPAAPDLGSW